MARARSSTRKREGPLAKYRRMRDFSKTREPRGRVGRKAETGRLSFFIQRHAATRLHYDFRLELDGVLKSWAVPKGPAYDPAEKRLAVHVEDHPLDYGPFEGEIPKGEYGGGKVLLWDLGRWIPDGDPREGYRKGRLKFRLEGRKLRGRWTLVAMGGPAGEGRKNWLLIKERDGDARPLAEYDVVAERPESAKSGAQAAPELSSIPGAVRAPFPERVEPQLATLADRVPPGDAWLHEIKLDGYRILAAVRDARPRLYSRRWNDWTAEFKLIASELEAWAGHQLLLDGELVALDPEGRSDFQRLQNALDKSEPAALAYYVFDLLYADGWDLRAAPLAERKKALKALLGEGSPRIRFTEHVEGEGTQLLAGARELGLEGIVSKRASGRYASGRGKDWLKVKCLQEQEFVVGGWTEPSGARTAFGALLLGVRRPDGSLEFVGRVGTGFSTATLKTLHARLKRLEEPLAPFSNPPKDADARGAHWARPELVAQVAFTGWTRERQLRQPSFKGLRRDKSPEEVVLEAPRTPAPEPPPAAAAAAVRLSNPGRVLYPELGVTKRELAEYYESAAELILPHLARRPLAIVRCPGGRGKPCFFQKHGGAEFPEAIRSVDIRDRDGEVLPNIWIDDLEGLISLVQLGALELHPWGSRVDALERPDRAIFDIDPSPGVEWARVVRAAEELRERLAGVGLESFLKTTGGKGLHVVVPFEPRDEWPRVKGFCHAVAETMARESPSEYTARLPKADRVGKLFIDYLRNDRGSTAVAPYSTRAREGAPVAAPLAWEELTPSLKPGQFGVRSMARRLKSRADPWARFFAVRQSLP